MKITYNVKLDENKSEDITITRYDEELSSRLLQLKYEFLHTALKYNEPEKYKNTTIDDIKSIKID